MRECILRRWSLDHRRCCAGQSPSSSIRPVFQAKRQAVGVPARRRAPHSACHCGDFRGMPSSQSSGQGSAAAASTSNRPVSTSPIHAESQSRSAAVDQGLPTVHPAGRTPAAGRPTSGRAAIQRSPSLTTIAWKGDCGAKCSIHRASVSARSVGKATLLRHHRSSQRTASPRSSSIDAM